jgi:hypothetical protein
MKWYLTILSLIFFILSCSKKQFIKQQDLAIKFYPNPCTTSITISAFKNIETCFEYEIINLVGVVVQKGNLPSLPATLSVTAIPIGTYIFKVSKNGISQVTLFLQKN